MGWNLNQIGGYAAMICMGIKSKIKQGFFWIKMWFKFGKGFLFLLLAPPLLFPLLLLFFGIR
jgi:hypothetical protein